MDGYPLDCYGYESTCGAKNHPVVYIRLVVQICPIVVHKFDSTKNSAHSSVWCKSAQMVEKTEKEMKMSGWCRNYAPRLAALQLKNNLIDLERESLDPYVWSDHINFLSLEDPFPFLQPPP